MVGILSSVWSNIRANRAYVLAQLDVFAIVLILPCGPLAISTQSMIAIHDRMCSNNQLKTFGYG